MTLDPALLAEVRDLDRQATPGPWHDRHVKTPRGYSTSAVSPDTAEQDELSPADLALFGRIVALNLSGNDARLIARYRTLAPLLADEVERLRAELAHHAALSAAWNEGASTARGVLSTDPTAEPHDHIPDHYRADEELAGAWMAGWAADAAIVGLDEARLTLAAEQGRPEGAPSSRWTWRGGCWQVGTDTDLVARAWPGGRLYLCGRLSIHDTARAAMLAADATLQDTENNS